MMASKRFCAINSASAVAWWGMGATKSRTMIEVDPLDTRRFGAPGIVGVEPGVVEIRRGGYRVRRGPRRADQRGSIRAAQDGDLVAAVRQALRDIQQRADVPDR